MKMDIKQEEELQIKQEETIITEEYISLPEQKEPILLTTLAKHIKKQFLVQHYKCEHCNYKTLFEKIFEKHCLTCEVRNKQEYQCAICMYIADRKYLIRKHVITHTTLKPFACKLCDYKTRYNSSLKLHERVHTERSYRCTLCRFKAVNKNKLKLHLERHAKNALYKCHICEKWFKYKNMLKRHIGKHSVEKKFFNCAHCSYGTTVRYYLKNHLATHRNERPFACPQCPYRAKIQCIISKHKKTVHSKVRNRINKKKAKA